MCIFGKIILWYLHSIYINVGKQYHKYTTKSKNRRIFVEKYDQKCFWLFIKTKMLLLSLVGFQSNSPIFLRHARIILSSSYGRIKRIRFVQIVRIASSKAEINNSMQLKSCHIPNEYATVNFEYFKYRHIIYVYILHESRVMKMYTKQWPKGFKSISELCIKNRLVTL